MARCEAPSSAFHIENSSIYIPVTPELFKQQRYDDALRAACDALSAQGINNFIHYAWDESNQHRETLVELFNPSRFYAPIINYNTNSIELREHDLCETP